MEWDKKFKIFYKMSKEALRKAKQVNLSTLEECLGSGDPGFFIEAFTLFSSVLLSGFSNLSLLIYLNTFDYQNFLIEFFCPFIDFNQNRDTEDNLCKIIIRVFLERVFSFLKKLSYSFENLKQIVSGTLNMLKIKRGFSLITISPLKNERRWECYIIKTLLMELTAKINWFDWDVTKTLNLWYQEIYKDNYRFIKTVLIFVIFRRWILGANLVFKCPTSSSDHRFILWSLFLLSLYEKFKEAGSFSFKERLGEV